MALEFPRSFIHSFHFIYFNESLLKIMRNAFCFMLKALSALEIFTFFSCFFGCVERNGLIRKLWLISKFMVSQTGQQIIKVRTKLCCGL